MKVRNFLFHRVSPFRDQLWDPMSVELFGKCIAYISSKYQITTIENLLSIDFKKTKVEYATISFDDGYKDNIEYALPILNKYKVKASFYVVTDCIENNEPTWTHILEFLFQNSSNSKISLNFDFLPVDLRINQLIDLHAKIAYVKKLKPYLKKLSSDERKLVMNEIKISFNDVRLPEIMMNWDDLKTLMSFGHIIGSHSVTHNMLGTITDINELKSELEKSAQIITNKLGVSPIAISYPVGSYNEDVIKLSKLAGYKLGLAVKQEIFIPGNYSLFEIPRIELYNESWWKTKLRISNRLEDIKKIIKYR
jgi:peptidoglycan/xylan/chitin deacetylase (PgdA/CDA1 family)